MRAQPHPVERSRHGRQHVDGDARVGPPVLEKVLRPIIVYLFLVVALRFAGKRELAQLTPLDLVVLLMLSNTVQNAIIGEDHSLVGGMIGAMALLVVNAMMARALFAHPKLDAGGGGRADRARRAAAGSTRRPSAGAR